LLLSLEFCLHLYFTR